MPVYISTQRDAAIGVQFVRGEAPMDNPAGVVATLISALDEYERAQFVEHALSHWGGDLSGDATCDRLRACFDACDPRTLTVLAKRDALDPALRLAQVFYEAGVIHGILSTPGLSSLAMPERGDIGEQIMRELEFFFSMRDGLEGILAE